jgi:hypothetical protein
VHPPASCRVKDVREIPEIRLAARYLDPVPADYPLAKELLIKTH